MDAGGPLLPLDHDQGWDEAHAGMAEAFIPGVADDLHGGDDAALPPAHAPLPPLPLRRRRPGPPLGRAFWSLVGAGSIALGTAAAAGVVSRAFPVMDEVPARSSHQIRPTPAGNLSFPEYVPDLMDDGAVWASIPRDGTSIAEVHGATFTSYQLPSSGAPLPECVPDLMDDGAVWASIPRDGTSIAETHGSTFTSYLLPSPGALPSRGAPLPGASPFGHLPSREFQRSQGTSVALPDRHSDGFVGDGFSTVARLWGSALVLLVLALVVLLKMAV